MRSVAPQFDCGPPGSPAAAVPPDAGAPLAPPGFFLKKARITAARSRVVPCSTSAEPLQVDSQALFTNVLLSAEMSIGALDCVAMPWAPAPAATAASATPSAAERKCPIDPELRAPRLP